MMAAGLDRRCHHEGQEEGGAARAGSDHGEGGWGSTGRWGGGRTAASGTRAHHPGGPSLPFPGIPRASPAFQRSVRVRPPPLIPLTLATVFPAWAHSAPAPPRSVVVAPPPPPLPLPSAAFSAAGAPPPPAHAPPPPAAAQPADDSI